MLQKSVTPASSITADGQTRHRRACRMFLSLVRLRHQYLFEEFRDAGPGALLFSRLMAHQDDATVAVSPRSARIQPDRVAKLGCHDRQERSRQARPKLTVVGTLGLPIFRKLLDRHDQTCVSGGERTALDSAAVADAKDLLPGRRNLSAQLALPLVDRLLRSRPGEA